MTDFLTAASAMQQMLKPPSQPERLITAANIGCRALTNSLGDPDFKRKVDDLSRKSPTDDLTDRGWNINLVKEFPKLLNEISLLMINNGMSPQMAQDICRQIENLQQPMRSWHGGQQYHILIYPIQHRSTFPISRHLSSRNRLYGMLWRPLDPHCHKSLYSCIFVTQKYLLMLFVHERH